MNKELTKKMSPGHTTCAGCPIGIITRTILNATDDPVVVTNATGCMEVTTTIYPNTSWKVPYIHSVFGNAGATISGIEAAYHSLKKQKKIKKKPKFIAFAGDGGTYDIGLQALSGALERGHDFLFVCYDNGAYMNTGNQRSGATPLFASTETTPFGNGSLGKEIPRKNIMDIVAAHNVPYCATANVGFLEDLEKKAKKALKIKGPKFLLVFSPCVNEWRYSPSKTIEIARLATQTNFWPLYEIEHGNYTINHINKKRLPIEKFHETQGRFKHLFKNKNNKKIMRSIQFDVDNQWRKLRKKEACK